MKNFQYSENDRQFDNDMQAGISAMTAAVASIPERYYKYNAILSAKMDNALCRIDLINREMKKQIGNVSKTRILQMQILNLLHAIWKTAWAKFSPKARIQQAADSPFSIGETIHAETCLNRLHMWKRIVETESVNPNELLKRSFRELQEAPTHLFRCNPYTPPHIYVAGYEMKGGRTFGAASDGLDELISEVRLAFMDLAVREKVHRDVEMDSILTEVVDSYRATEVDSGTKSGTDWGYITQKLRKEFWLSKKPSDLEDRLERWAKSSKNVSHQGTEEGRGLRDKGQRNCMVARKKGVRWEEDRYY
ncbi:hypothetical protein BC830DRAFT_856150 [Chytriomyces sp. MP71]|nr:hypothetical protein BC830DRAFT_856150 [Chytriomyces sp. MP71]